VHLELSEELKPYFSTKKNPFAEIMQTHGEVFRELENRSTQKIILNQKSYFLKKHFGIGWREIFKNLLQLKLPVLSAKNEWQAIRHLQKINISVPEITAYGLQGCNPARIQSFIMTRALPHHISLEDYTRRWATTPPSLNEKRALIQKVANIAKCMHNAGINHRDFYLCHFLLTDDNELFLIDLHRAGIRTTVPNRWRIKDLAGLYFSSKNIALSRQDLLHFIKAYREAPLRDIFNKENSFWRRVKQHGDRLYQKHVT